MKTQRFFLPFLLFSLTAVFAWGQQRCATMEADSELRALHPELGSLDYLEKVIAAHLEAGAQSRVVNGTLIIPVVVHVIHSNEAVGSGTNISEAQVLSQIDVLNEDFGRYGNGLNTHPNGANTGIQFCLAKRKPDGTATNGIDRIFYGAAPYNFTAPPYSVRAYIESTIKPATGWDPTRYLNLWCLNFGSSLLGYAQFPSASGLPGMNCSGGNNNTDGIAMQYNAFGRVGTLLAGYSKGKTCTHEVGHWLGLRHIWGDATCGDDFCGDTPTHETANYNCPGHPKPNNCGSADEMVENYMDYTNDVCMNIFTNDQATRMRTVLLASPLRLSLLSSDACIPPATNDAAIVNIQSPITDVCPGPLAPLVTLKNMGSNTLTSATIQYQWNGGVVSSQAFTGSLAPGASQTIALPTFNASAGAQSLRVYSILPNGVSDPNTLGDTTDVAFTAWTGASIPYSEPFEATTWPPSGWSINNASNDCYTWRKVTGIRGASGTASGTIWLNHFAYTTNLGDSDEVSTNILNLSSATANTYLTFDVAYAARNSTNFESLRLYASTDCGATYPFLLYNKNGMGSGSSNLSTVSGFVGGSFSPSGASQWRREIIPLSTFAGSNIRLKWVAVNRNGNNLFLDNIEVKDGRLVGFTTSTGSFVESSTGGTQGCLGYQDYQVSVGINAAPSAPITVNASLLLGTALSSDVQLITSTLVFPAGSAANQNVTIRVWDDAAIESPRSFTLVLNSLSASVILQNNAFTGIITDNDQNLGAGVVTLFTQNFETATNGTILPTGWTTPATTGATNVFVVGPNAGLGGTKALYISNNTTTLPLNYTLTSITNRSVQTPVINTVGTANLLLNFSLVCAGEVFGNTVYDFGGLYYSTSPTGPFTAIIGPSYTSNTFINGGSGLYNVNQPTTVSIYLPEACEGLSALYLTWRWRNDDTEGSQPPIAIDDIVLTGATVPSVATALNSTDTEYLGPNQTVTFRSAAGGLIAKITNNSTFDYGCTTVTIDNAGTGIRAYYNQPTANHLAAKSILVQPTNNTATGSFDLTLYFSTTEASGFIGGTGLSWTSTSNVLYKSNGAIGNVTPTSYIGNGTGNQQVGTQISTRDLTSTVRRIQSRFNTGFRSGGSAGFAAGSAGARTVLLNPSGGTVCLGSTQTLAFYALGNFTTGNSFVANLSSSGGTFSAVNNIGSVAAVSNGCYTGTINANLPASGGGNNFLIRIEPSTAPSSINTPSSFFYLGGAGTWRGATSSNWSISGNWCGSIPTSTVDAVIPSGNAFLPSLTAASACRALTINSDATLSLNNQNLTLSGAISGPGRIIGSSTSELTFNGSAGSTLSLANINLSSRSLGNLTLAYTNSATSLTLGDSLVLNNALTISSGTLQTANRLRLASNATKTAYISALNNNSIIQGDLIAEKFAPGGKTGWALIGNPVTGDNILDWQDDFPTSGFAGATGYAGGFTSVYSYNETFSGSIGTGYIAPASSSETVTPGKGYMVYLGTAFPNTPSITVDATGPPVTGTFSLPVSYTSSIPNALPNEDGWCLVANPYCSTLDWDSPNWTRTNIGNYFYVYNADLGSYGTYVGGSPGVGTNGASNLIGSFQGFWVKAFAANPALTLTEQTKSNAQSTLLRTHHDPHNLIRVQAENSEGKDEAVVVFHHDTENLPQVPKQWPWKESCPGIAFATDSLPPLAIMQINQQRESGRLPLAFAKANATHLVVSPNFTFDAHVFLEDVRAGALYPCQNGKANSFSLDTLSAQGRYFLTWSLPNSEPESAGEVFLFPNPANRTVWFSSPEKGVFELSWFTLDGRLVHRVSEAQNGQGPMDLSHLETGVYLVEIKGLDKQRKVIKFVVKS